jgi:ATP-dependent DNA helicase PIF1
MPKKRKAPKIELNPQFRQALDAIETTNNNVFVTGRAGTGKSTLLTYFREHTKKKVVVLAPTGVAALNVKGQTVHSFFRFKPDITPEKVKKLRTGNLSIYRLLDAIVIDEISMVRADLLDCADVFLRLHGPRGDRPFGGIQMIFIGDLYQLPPVVKGEEREIFSTVYETPYFFSSRAFGQMQIEFIELEKIYRQHDEKFIRLLNAIRNNSVTPDDLEALNERYLPEYEPPAKDFYIYLTTTNELADNINSARLDKLKGELFSFPGRSEGEFGRENLPTKVELNCKIGAQIMMLNNDPMGRWVNGTIGKIVDILHEKNQQPVIIAGLADGEEVEIVPNTWEIFRFFAEEGQLKSEVVGTFTQYPVMLAWAVTIHKGQGKTFEKVIIDIGRGTFAHGQMYVALSRCTRLDGIVLKKPFQKSHIWMDRKVVQFLTRRQYAEAEKELSLEDKTAIIEKAIKNRSKLEIVYLKPNDEKSHRVIRPKKIGEMHYEDYVFFGVQAFCYSRLADRVFRVDRILDIKEAA